MIVFFIVYHFLCANVGMSSFFLEEDFLILVSALAILAGAALEMRRDRGWEEKVVTNLVRCEERISFLEKEIDWVKDCLQRSIREGEKHHE